MSVIHFFLLKWEKFYFFKRYFLFSVHDRVVTIKSRNFSFAKVWCCPGLYWSTRGCNLAVHSSIHASSILRKGLTRFQLPKCFLGLRIIECRNSWYTGMRPRCYTDRKHHTHKNWEIGKSKWCFGEENEMLSLKVSKRKNLSYDVHFFTFPFGSSKML